MHATELAWALGNVARSRDLVFQSRILPLIVAMASVRPSGEKATASTESPTAEGSARFATWASIALRGSPTTCQVAVSQILAVPS